MATVEDRYQAAIAYVRRAIAAVEKGPLTMFDPFSEAADYYAARTKTATARSELQRIEGRWMFATNDIERARVAREAELLADRVQEALPGAPQDRKRTNLFPGETQTSTPGTDFESELHQRADEAWNWLKHGAETVADDAGSVGKWLLVGSAVLLAVQAFSYLRERDRRNRSLPLQRRQLNAALERAAQRNASVGPNTMCPICHRHHWTDTDGRLVPHEYPIAGVCPGSGKAPLTPNQRPTVRRHRKVRR